LYLVLKNYLLLLVLTPLRLDITWH